MLEKRMHRCRAGTIITKTRQFDISCARVRLLPMNPRTPPCAYTSRKYVRVPSILILEKRPLKESDQLSSCVLAVRYILSTLYAPKALAVSQRVKLLKKNHLTDLPSLYKLTKKHLMLHACMFIRRVKQLFALVNPRNYARFERHTIIIKITSALYSHQ